MKKHINRIILLIFVVSAILISCKKDDSNLTISPIISTGSWRVTYYHETNEDHTNNFSDYIFTFNSNGTMAATKAGVTTNGTWNNDDSRNEFHMSLGTANPLKDLSKGWLVISKTSSEIKLQDDNAAHTEELHFTKN